MVVPKFSPTKWAMLNELASEFERCPEPANGPTKTKLRAAMRGLGFKISNYGEHNVSPSLLARLLEEKRIRIAP